MEPVVPAWVPTRFPAKGLGYNMASICFGLGRPKRSHVCNNVPIGNAQQTASGRLGGSFANKDAFYPIP